LLDISKEDDGLKFQNRLLREREGERGEFWFEIL
jgi:hypothetical protein